MNRRLVRHGEPLAILESALHSDHRAMWWDQFQEIPDNYRCGAENEFAVVSIRGSLEHHREFGTDSYERILDRAKAAFAGEDRDEWEDDDAEDDAGMAESSVAGRPKAVILRIDSPGGVVSGLNECVFALRKLSKKYDIPLIAYVDEMAASAAYALSCACQRIVIPKSGICGSIGVISALFDVTAADKKAGIRFETITSGDRKADGHPHVPISKDMIAVERNRVMILAKQFWKLVAQRRPLSVKAIKALECGIFLGAEAVPIGLADAVQGWDEFTLDPIGASTKLPTGRKISLADQSQSVSTVKKTGGTRATLATDEVDPMGIRAALKKAKAALKSEKDPKKKKALLATVAGYQSALEAYKKTKRSIEKEETEEGSDDEENEESAETEEEDESEESAETEEEDEESKGNETDRKQKKKSKKGATPPGKSDDDPDRSDDDDDSGDDDDEDEDDEEDEEESEEEDEAAAKKAAHAAISRSGSGRRALGKLTAVFAKARKYDNLNRRVKTIEADARRAKKSAIIDEAVAQRRITRSMAKVLRKKDLKFVQGTLEMHKSAMVHIDEESLPVPTNTPHADLPAAVLKSIDTAVAAANLPTEKARLELHAQLVTAQRERLAQANGAGRY